MGILENWKRKKCSSCKGRSHLTLQASFTAAGLLFILIYVYHYPALTAFNVPQTEEKLISMYINHAEKSTHIHPVVITTLEQLPEDNIDLLSQWLAGDLVTVMDHMYGIFERDDRAVIGVATGGITALQAGEI